MSDPESPPAPAGSNSLPSSDSSPPAPPSSDSSPPAPDSSPPARDQSPSPPESSTSLNSAPPPAHNDNSSPPPSSNSSSPSPPSPLPLDSESSPPGSPPSSSNSTSSNSTSSSPPSNSGPPESSSLPSPPPSSPNSNSSKTPPSPSPGSTSPASPPPPPPAPSQQSPPPSAQQSNPSPPPPDKSLPAPAPSNGSSTLPVPTTSQPPTPSPPTPVANTPPITSDPNSTTSAGHSSPESGSTSPPPSREPPRVPSLSPPSNSKSETSSSGDSSPSSGSGGGNGGAVVGVTVASVFIIALIALFFVISRRRKRRDAFPTHYIPPNSISVKTDGYYHGQQHSMLYSGPPNTFSGLQPPRSSIENSYGSQRGHMYHGGAPESGVIGGAKTFFSYEELMEITNGFSRQNVLGEGGFGCVYKGWLPDGRVVAVKQLKAGSGQGEREFRAEVEIISRVHHRHLVSLVGYCISEQQRLLIYEFVPNGTLEQHLHGNGLQVLDWAQRVKIAIGSAKGLAYLHEDCHPTIIHRDIKSANILLDDAFEAQVADFGLAKLNDSTQTHVSTRVMGTFGYLAPEYASSGKLTDRSDVFSFGVVLLELITGRKPVDASQPLGDESLVEWARPLLIHALETGDMSELVDPRLEKHYVESEVFTMIEAAAACVRHSGPKRPRMVQVVRALDSVGEMSDLSNGVKYGQSTVYDSGQYNQDIMKFRRMALGSDDSSEYDMYSRQYTSRQVSGGPSNSWKSSNVSSEGTSGELETQAMNPSSGEQRYGGAKGNYGGRRFGQL